MIEVRDLSVGYSNPANTPVIFEHSDDYDSPEIVLRNISLKFESGAKAIPLSTAQSPSGMPT